MGSTWEAFLQSWPLDPWVVVPLLLTAIIYLRGWRTLHQYAPHRFGPTQLCSFLGGLAALFLALASPLEPFADLLLQVHMLQHLLLMMVAPPLLWLGASAGPLAPRPAVANSVVLGGAVPAAPFRRAPPADF